MHLTYGTRSENEVGDKVELHCEDPYTKTEKEVRNMKVILCGDGKCCAEVVLAADGVEIGEAKLTVAEWNLLVDKIRSGELKKIESA